MVEEKGTVVAEARRVLGEAEGDAWVEVDRGVALRAGDHR
jgi:hypothetical protein